MLQSPVLATQSKMPAPGPPCAALWLHLPTHTHLCLRLQRVPRKDTGPTRTRQWPGEQSRRQCPAAAPHPSGGGHRSCPGPEGAQPQVMATGFHAGQPGGPPQPRTPQDRLRLQQNRPYPRPFHSVPGFSCSHPCLLPTSSSVLGLQGPKCSSQMGSTAPLDKVLGMQIPGPSDVPSVDPAKCSS